MAVQEGASLWWQWAFYQEGPKVPHLPPLSLDQNEQEGILDSLFGRAVEFVRYVRGHWDETLILQIDIVINIYIPNSMFVTNKSISKICKTADFG